MTATEFLRNALAFAPLPVLQVLVRRDLVSLMYHAVSDTPPPHLRHLYAIKSPAQFEQDLLYLRRHFDLLAYDQLEQRQRHRGATGRPGVLVTFDDGLSECFTTVRPLLIQHRVPCVFFVTTGSLDNRRMFYRHKVSLCLGHVAALGEAERQRALATLRSLEPSLRDAAGLSSWLKGLHHDEAVIDGVCAVLGIDIAEALRRTRPYLTVDQVRQLAEDGFTIGSHTVSHRLLDTLPAAEIEREVIESTGAIQDLTRQRKVPFSIPFSSDGIDPAILHRLVVTQPSLGHVFGGGGIRRRDAHVVHRVPCDEPGPPGGRSSNLPRLLRSAWAREALRSARA
jgi:peptidoglycan/xylan/chitin deacetylase (PgdA/CDA1 family)